MDEGGDPSCWLGLVCPECGKIREDRTAETCPYCGTAVDDPPVVRDVAADGGE
ncbi:zinc-ribbon domain-containing protein [Streptomyces boninensis]|uniref:zinc-ribbon domain-containing protein n=1 Tax=Streptomyces boninensis TaxID=2039455 RepID=UPI003B221671